MKGILKDICSAVFMGMILPGCLLNFASAVMDPPAGELPEETPWEETMPETTEETLAASVPLTMYLQTEGGCREQDMDGYLTGVVLAEMPASFEEEALKAQAVAARTYTRKAYETGGKHGNGSVCGNSACCQAYITPEAYLEKGGSWENLVKVRGAVASTSGEVLTYEGELIEATYFSCSGGTTEDAVAVWGTDYPYLQAVESPGEEKAAHYMDSVVFTARDFQAALGQVLEGSPKSWIGTATYTEGGGVAWMKIGGKTYSGTQLRSLLGLKSTAFSILPEEDILTILTRGYGHRVGMSQYGADAMAAAGKGYEEILAHYYPGTALIKLEIDK